MSHPIVERALAKVNIALHILGRRVDGYHELDSIVAFANCADVLTLVPATSTSLQVTGRFASDVPTDETNLVLKAYKALASRMRLPSVSVTLEKNLPVASGIGGGSADAAAMLLGLMRLAGTPLESTELSALALSLGADVPVCLHGTTCRMSGMGDMITTLERPVAPAIVLANPLKPCATAPVFAQLALKPGEALGSALDLDDPASWRNDLQAPAIAVLPVIADVLDALRQQDGLSVVRMSGSGATCFGLAPSLAMAQSVAASLQELHPGWWIAAAGLT